MRHVRIVSLFALLSLALGCGAPVALALPNPSASANAQSQARTAAKIRALLLKYRQGGRALVLAIQNLLVRDPGAIGAVISAAGQANVEQALAMEQGVVQAQAQLKAGGDPTGGYNTIQSYLYANKTDPVVAQILRHDSAEGAPNGNRDGDGNRHGDGGGFGGGGFVGGGGGGGGRGGDVVSRH